jgi:transketolase
MDKKELKKTIIDSAHKAKEGHIPSALSILDILIVLYDKILDIDPKNPESYSRDRFVLSKGHASLGLYVILAKKGFFSHTNLYEFGKFESFLGGHPNRNKVPGVEASTGSLGHGLPIALGIALGLKIKKNNHKVYVLIGDGEANEGTVWESAMIAAHHNLNNLICIVDHNHSTDRAVKICELEDKFRSFGWEAKTIDGHDHEAIYEALTSLHTAKPTAIIAQTIKGKGIKMMENDPAWHHRFPTDEELEQILKELD